MDPYSQYQQQLKYYDYVETQRENPIDLTTDSNQQDMIKKLADILFTKHIDHLNDDLMGILIDDDMDIIDIFSMLLELVTYGLDIIQHGKKWFEFTNSYHDVFYDLNKYLKSIGFVMDVNEIFDFIDNVNLYRDRTDYYCQIVSKPPPFLCVDSWYLLDYRFITNINCVFDNNTPLREFKAFFINNEKRIFTINFDFTNSL